MKLVHVDIRAQGTNYKGLGKVKCFMVVSNRWTGLWTGLLDWIAGLDSEERCQTSMQDCMCSEDLCLTRSYRRS